MKARIHAAMVAFGSIAWAACGVGVVAGGGIGGTGGTDPGTSTGSPIARFTATPASGPVGSLFQFSAGESTDPTQPEAQVQVRWDWESDGVWDIPFSTVLRAAHVFTQVGIHHVRLEVRNADGITSAATQIVNVLPKAGGPAPTPAPTTPAPVSADVQNVLSLIESHNVYASPNAAQNRELLRTPLKQLSVAESTELMDAVRKAGKVSALVSALIDIRPSAVNPSKLKSAWSDVLSSGKLDFMVEVLTYVDYNSDEGTYCSGTSVHIYDYGLDPGVLIHESYHAFNDVHGVDGINGLNEGSGITAAKIYASGWKNLAETIFGTVLYYRDIGIPGYPKDIPFGDANAYDAKGRDALRSLMSVDESKIDWFSTSRVKTLFDLFWKRLDRNVGWSKWESDARAATQQGRDWLASHP